jgi:hypothetical protein
MQTLDHPLHLHVLHVALCVEIQFLSTLQKRQKEKRHSYLIHIEYIEFYARVKLVGVNSKWCQV